MLAGTLAGIELGLALAHLPFSRGRVAAALDYLSASWIVFAVIALPSVPLLCCRAGDG